MTLRLVMQFVYVTAEPRVLGKQRHLASWEDFDVLQFFPEGQ